MGDPRIKLNFDSASQIRHRHSLGETRASLAGFFAVSEKAIQDVISYDTWKVEQKTNPIVRFAVFADDYVSIPLTNEKWARIDYEDFEQVSAFTWTATKQCRTWYASAKINGKMVALHRFVMKAVRGQVIDHIDRNGLNNQKTNLRFCTRGENRRNAIGWPETRKSRFKGLSINKGRWQVRIKINKKTICLGTYADEVEAARAYDAGAVQFHGEFARLNFNN